MKRVCDAFGYLGGSMICLGNREMNRAGDLIIIDYPQASMTVAMKRLLEGVKQNLQTERIICGLPKLKHAIHVRSEIKGKVYSRSY